MRTYGRQNGRIKRWTEGWHRWVNSFWLLCPILFLFILESVLREFLILFFCYHRCKKKKKKKLEGKGVDRDRNNGCSY